MVWFSAFSPNLQGPVGQAYKELIETIQESPSHNTADPGDILKNILETVEEFKRRGQNVANELLHIC